MKRYLFTPGPTPVPPEVLAAVGAPVVHHRSPDFLPVYERVLDPSARGLPDRERRAPLRRFRNRRLRVGGREPRLARRAAPRGLGRKLRRALGCDDDGVRRRGRRAPVRLGRDAGRRTTCARACASGRRRPSGSFSPRRPPGSSPTFAPSRPRRARPARSSSSTRFRASAPSPARPTPGGSTWSSPARRRRSCLRRASASPRSPKPRSPRPVPRRASTSTGNARARRRRASTRRSRFRSRSCAVSTSRSSSCSRRASRCPSTDTSGSDARRARASRRSASSCSPRTRTAAPS